MGNVVNRQYLLDTLELIAPALATHNMVPIFQSFTFQEGFVSAYNDSIAITAPCDFEGTCGLNGKILLGLLGTSKAEEMSIELKDQVAHLKLGKTTSKLPFDPEENFIFDSPADTWVQKLALTDSFFKALNLCLATVSKDQTQAALLGVTIQGNKMYSCDGDAVTRVILEQGPAKHRIMLPTAFCEAAANLWAKLTMTKGVLKFNDEWVYIDLGEWSIYGRVLKIDKPIDFDAEIKKAIQVEIETQPIPEGLAAALARAQVIAAAESQKTEIKISKGKIDIFTETHMGEVSDTLAFKGHPDTKVNVNASHLQRAIKHCDRVAFHDNGTLFEGGEGITMFVSNM
jgi:hypothetical protein